LKKQTYRKGGLVWATYLLFSCPKSINLIESVSKQIFTIGEKEVLGFYLEMRIGNKG
jgi:hypothetical protein